MNQITLLGRLTKDPDMRYTDKGIAVTRFTIAVSREGTDKTDFINCITFRKVAENLAQYCKKGRQLLVSGRLEINSRTNETNNQTDYFTQVVANRIEFLSQPKSQQQQQQPEQYQQQGNFQQQRFQPGPNGWQTPNDTDLAF
ncbi:MAG TPA: single-stranded DNA-binding protein [Bacillota bacterium]|nr:single-stranded DNA-binding protein [Bacillota bacterium]